MPDRPDLIALAQARAAARLANGEPPPPFTLVPQGETVEIAHVVVRGWANVAPTFELSILDGYEDESDFLSLFVGEGEDAQPLGTWRLTETAEDWTPYWIGFDGASPIELLDVLIGALVGGSFYFVEDVRLSFRMTGRPARDESLGGLEIDMSAATGEGTFTLADSNASRDTGPLAFDVSDEDLAAALEDMLELEAGDVDLERTYNEADRRVWTVRAPSNRFEFVGASFADGVDSVNLGGVAGYIAAADPTTRVRSVKLYT